MSLEILENHKSAPSAVAFMARAFLPSPGLTQDRGFPRIVQRWTRLRIDPKHVEAFHRATGIDDDDGISVLYPHVLGFRLQMALLTHPAFPLPIWSALQIRNRLVRHRSVDLRETLELETTTGAQRLVDKGIEVDLVSRLTRGSDCCWESNVTYFYRGRYGAGGPETPEAASPELSGASEIERFQMPRRGGWRFGGLTGDYNGIHTWPWYARRFGFRTAFPHPQRVAGMCMARLRGPESDAQILELWIKGPVYYGANVVLSATTNDQGIQFGLSLDGDHRAALSGRWQRASS
jgi:hypothetical protein